MKNYCQLFISEYVGSKKDAKIGKKLVETPEFFGNTFSKQQKLKDQLYH